MIVQKGRYFQMWKTITAPSAVSCWASHGTEANPNLPRRWLKMPHCELSIQRKERMPGSVWERTRRATRGVARWTAARVVGRVGGAIRIAGEDGVLELGGLVGRPVDRLVLYGGQRDGVMRLVLVEERGEDGVLVVL